MKKGFTLIELLAVIVILAIISLIATPTLTKVVSNAKKSAAIESANGYVDSINTQIISSELSTSSKNINDGTYNINDLDINIKGKKPDNGIVTVDKKNVKEARLCIGKYSVDYDGHDTKLSSNNYCGETKVTILSNEKEINSTTKSSRTYTVDLKDKTNINCSNGAIPEINGNTLTVKNAIGNTTCDIGSSLKYTFTHLNDGDNNIIMVNDETVTEKVVLNKDYSVNLDLNGKKITMNNLNDPESKKIPTDYDFQHFIIQLYGKLVINDSAGTGEMQGYEGSGEVEAKKGSYLVINGGKYTKGRSVLNSGATVIINNGTFDAYFNAYRSNYNDSKTIINGGRFFHYINDTYATISIGAGDVIINDGYFESTNGATLNFTPTSKNKVVINGGVFKSVGTNGSAKNINIKGSVAQDELVIKGGTFISNSGFALTQSGGVVYINQTDKPIYMRSDAKAWRPVISIYSGSIYIKANKANKCTNNESDTKSGLCVFAIGDGNGNTSTNGNVAVQNAGSIFINGGTYIGGWSAIYGGGNGSLSNVTNAEIIGGRNGVGLSQHPTAILNICNSTIKANVFDIANLSNDNTSVISYSNTVTFNDGTNTPKVWNPNGTINANYMGTCTK